MKDAITEKDAIELAREMFSKASDRRSKAYDHWSKAYDHWSKASDHRSKAYDHWSKAYAIFYKILSEKEIRHSVPDHRAFNVNCADRVGVYCFVWTRQEVWIYDGERCPDSDTVEKLNWK